MEHLQSYINEARGKYPPYTLLVAIPPFEMSVIKDALNSYKNDKDRKRNEGNGQASLKQIDDVLNWLDSQKNYA